MARLPAAPGAYGQPPVPPVDAVEAADARRPARPRRWRAPSRACRGSGTRSARAGCRPPRPAPVSAATWPGTPTPIVSPKQTSSTPSSSRRSGDLDGACRARRARCTGSRTRSRRSRAATSRGRRHARGPARTPSSDSSTVIPMFALGEGVGRGGEDGDRVGAGRLGPGQAALVRDEDRVADARRVAAGRRAGRRRRPAAGSRSATTKRRRLDLAQAGVGEELDEPRACRGRDRRRLVLEPVARPDLVDPDVLGRRLGVVGRDRVGAAQTSGGSIARSMRAISTSIRPIRSIAAGVLLAAVRRGVAPPAGLAVEREQLVAGLRAAVFAHRAWTSVVRASLSVPDRGRGQGSMIARSWPRATWSPARRASSRDAPGDRRDDDVLHLHRLEGDDRVARPRPRSPTATWTARTGAGHRGDELGRPAPPAVPCARPRGRAIDVGRRREPEGDAPAGEVDVDDVADADGRRAPGASPVAGDRTACSTPSAVEADARRAVEPPAAGPRSSAVRVGREQRRGRGRPGLVRDRGARRPSRRAARSDRACRSGRRRRGRPAGGRASAGTAGS